MKDFDEMWDISRLYVSACSNSAQLVPLQPIIISILFHHYKELKEFISEVEQITEAATTKIQQNLQIDLKEGGKGEEGQLILERYLLPTRDRRRQENHCLNIKVVPSKGDKSNLIVYCG